MNETESYPPRQCLCEYYPNGVVIYNPACPAHEHGPVGVVLPCDTDHCTPEERAVITAAVARYEANLRSGEIYFEYDDDLDKAVSSLLTARAKKETG